MTLYLASQSPRRASLIRLIGLQDVQIKPANIDETMDPRLGPAENVRQLAIHKAQSVSERLTKQEGVILGADTTVALDGHILNKPADTADAERMLALLSDRTHTVYTGVALLNIASGEIRSFVESTEVTFRKLDKQEIAAYVATGAPMDKAGSYGIQEDFGAVFVRHIDGDYYNVVGLPIARLYVTLKSFAPEIFQGS